MALQAKRQHLSKRMVLVRQVLQLGHQIKMVVRDEVCPKSRKLREDGEKMLQELALTEEDIENIFDILEEDLPEL